jgi:uroporphyrinogen-III synthase
VTGPKQIRIAITRAEPEASATAARIAGLGAKPVLAPLLEIKRLSFNTNLDGAQALLFTSANGVRAFAEAAAARALPTFCVGDATARAAKDAGFADARSADGDSHALAALAAAGLDPKSGLVLHISGRETAGDIAGALASQGFEAERRIAYAAEFVSVAPEALRNPSDFILFHSARGAQAFIALGAPHASSMVAACHSDSVAQAASGAAFKRIIVAPSPREDALLRAVLSP